MRRFTFCGCVALALACARPQTPPNELTRFAGTWRVRGFNAAGDSIVGFQVVATGDTAGWTLVMPDRPAIPLRVVAAGGDSVVTEAGPYESILRANVQVRTRAVMRVQDDRLVGMTTARYTVTGADSVIQVRTEGTRVP